MINIYRHRKQTNKVQSNATGLLEEKLGWTPTPSPSLQQNREDGAFRWQRERQMRSSRRDHHDHLYVN